MTVEFEVNRMAEQKEKKRGKVPSNIVCKFFLDAIKKSIVGNGNDQMVMIVIIGILYPKDKEDAKDLKEEQEE